MTANDSDVSDGDILTGSQVVRVYGENLTSPFVTLTFGDVEYIPLAQGEDYIEYIISNNGTAIIAVDGSRFMSFEVEGVTPPSDLSGRVTANQTDSAQSSGAVINNRSTNDGCLNYPFKSNTEYPLFRVNIYGNSLERKLLTSVNCNVSNIFVGNSYISLWVIPIDQDKPCYIIYENFIVFVGNYTTD